MTYIYKVINEDAFHDAFRDYNRLENFSYEARQILFDYLQDLAETTEEPLELDVIGICCDFSEYASLEEYNKEYGTTHESWEAVGHNKNVMMLSGDGAVVQAS